MKATPGGIMKNVLVNWVHTRDRNIYFQGENTSVEQTKKYYLHRIPREKGNRTKLIICEIYHVFVVLENRLT